MGADDADADGGALLDEKAMRMRDLLSSFYSPDPSSTYDSSSFSGLASLDAINSPSFDAYLYMSFLVQKSNLEGLLKRHIEMAAEIKNLDTDLQMLVYENYNKFISATDTIKRMKSNIVGMESNMEQLLEKIMSVQSKSDGVNTSLFEKREHIEKLHRTRNLLRKVQFIYDLPARLAKCIKSEAYGDAVKFYTGAMPIFKMYGDSSFQDCRKASEEAIALITKKLQGKLFSDSESIQARAEAAMLLKQLDFPVDNLKVKLLEKLEQSLGDFSLQIVGPEVSVVNSGCPLPDSETKVSPNPAHEALVREFAEVICAYRVIFPDSENRLISLSRDLITRNFETTELYILKRIPSLDVLNVIKTTWTDVLLLHDVLPEAALHDRFFEATKDIIKKCIASRFSYLLSDISDILRGKEDGPGGVYSLQVALEASKKGVLQGSMEVLVDFQQFLDDKLELLVNLRDLIVDWVQEGFQDFFWKLDDQFFMLSGKKISNQEKGLAEGASNDKGLMSLVLILSQLCIFIEQSAIPRIAEDIAASFSGGAARGYEHGPAFVPGEICRRFRSAGEKFLHLYIKMSTQRISVILRKRLTTPNWVKVGIRKGDRYVLTPCFLRDESNSSDDFQHKEPREVHMFVDLLMQELERVGSEVKQILPQGLVRKHRRSDSNGSTTSSRSNPLRDDKIGRSNTQRARSQLLETHLAKLFKQKVEIFTKVEFTQESVLTTIIKLSLKSLQEFVRLQTFNRSGFQQIQLDIQFLRNPLKEISEDEAAIDFLLDEVIVSASERCLDPIPLEPPILEKLIQAKLTKSKG